MTRICLSFVVGTIIGLAPSVGLTSELPDSIRFFVDRDLPEIHHSSVKIYVHDVRDVGKTDQMLSRQLAQQESIASHQARLRIEQNFDVIRTSLQAEAEIYQLIEQFGIEQLPAVVVNDRVVIYGSTGIDDVVAKWLEATW